MKGMTKKERERWLTLAGDNSAGVSSKSDSKFCEDLERRGFVTHYDSMWGNDYYCLTAKGRREIYR